MHDSCGEKSRGNNAEEKNMLLILDIICITHVTSRGEMEFQVAALRQRMRTQIKSETSYTANDISRKVKKHVPVKPIGKWVIIALRSGSAHH